MEFGKIKAQGNLDITLPPDDPATARVLSSSQKSAPAPRIYVGCPLWQDAAMAKKLCPKGTPDSGRLACYARRFNAIELNGTGYAIVKEHVKQWAAEVGPEFRFVPKVPRDVSHSGDLDRAGEAFAFYCEAAELFGKSLGLSLLQFQDTFSSAHLPALERFLNAHAARLPLAVEVRHMDWFRDHAVKSAFLDLLEAHGVTSVLTDAPGRRDVLHQRLTTTTAFIRFNGYRLDPEDFRRLDEWAERLRVWLQRGLQTLYFFTHFDPKHFSVDLAAYFIKRLNRVCGLQLAEPVLQMAAPRLEPQVSLFPD